MDATACRDDVITRCTRAQQQMNKMALRISDVTHTCAHQHLRTTQGVDGDADGHCGCWLAIHDPGVRHVLFNADYVRNGIAPRHRCFAQVSLHIRMTAH